MDTLGEYLKREREGRGITLEEAAKTTKIRKTYLQAIEDGNFNIESPVFMKGFLKSYAQFLGLNITDILERYDREIHPEKAGEVKEEIKKPTPPVKYGRYLIAGILILSLLVIIAVTSLFKSKEPAPIEIKPAPQPQIFKETTAMANRTTHAMLTTAREKLFKPMTTIVVPIKPVMKTLTTPALPVKPIVMAHTTEKPGKKYTLVISAKEITWLRITVDNGSPKEVLLKKGESATWSADQKITVVAGNAGGVDLTLNGKRLGSLGEPGKVASKVLPE